MKTIVVSGEKSGVGKTHLAQELLKNLKGWGALKITVSKDGACPNGRNCGICSAIKKPFYIVKDEGVIKAPGKDTSRLKEAGAKEVIWLKAKPQGLRRGLKNALLEFSDCKGIIIEGSSVLKIFKPDLNIHVKSKGDYAVY
ncbi:MAG: hypothetical protein ACOY3D_08350 [Candidatus Omnitrophota bacterium]